ncbi:hypothetical protein APHAL10511_003702 [Amanita phalloides]|nr:hypothetical protein APHAL10511_003702 [Amanita phalloides]
MLVGTECGPSNPLQTLAKRFDQDRGLQQDYFEGNRAGSSRETFRSHTAGPVARDKEAAHFFAPQTTSHAVANPSLDLSALQSALPTNELPMHAQQLSAADWAADFLHNAESGLVTMNNLGYGNQQQHNALASTTNKYYVGPRVSQAGIQWNPAMSGFRMNQTPIHTRPDNVPMRAPVKLLMDETSWDKEFSSQELNMLQEGNLELVESQIQEPPDELAQTAAMLLEQLKYEQNPKFKNSQFMDLMRQLRDGKITVEGNEMVETSENTLDSKGKGRAIDDAGLGQSSFASPSSSQMAFLSNVPSSMDIRQVGSEEDNDAYFRQENEEYKRYWGEKFEPPVFNTVSASEAEWDKLQAEWDRFEATATGIREVETYPFRTDNPYLLGNPSRLQTSQQSRQLMIESVLELEATVQRDINNAMAWYHLGVKQQENEREQKALTALQRAVELDPSHLPSWLALAVSYTNDGNRTGTYDSISEWISRNEKYKGATMPIRGQSTQRYDDLINCLIAVARSNNESQIDADIQIALAILLNSNEEYGKAHDCFKTALAVKPEDWLLYNRVGATLANSGHAEDALQYYYRALELNPGYIRARFNLGISCINLRRYEEAVQHILDALILQENDGSMGQNRGVTSSTLWDSLKTACMHMRRADLSTLCDKRDLDGFRSTFQFNTSTAE